MELFQIIE